MHAKTIGQPPEAGDASLQVCAFYASERLFGVDILSVKEISECFAITPVYQAPPAIAGYINIRGQIHLVVDLRTVLGYAEGNQSEHSRVVLFKRTVAAPFGIRVDRIADVIEINRSHIDEPNGAGPADEQTTACSDPIAGVCRLQARLLTLLNPNSILSWAAHNDCCSNEYAIRRQPEAE